MQDFEGLLEHIFKRFVILFYFSLHDPHWFLGLEVVVCCFPSRHGYLVDPIRLADARIFTDVMLQA